MNTITIGNYGMPGLEHRLMRVVNVAGMIFLSLGALSSCKDSSPTGPANGASPVITGFTPTFGRAGDQVVITGRNFSSTKDSNRVFFAAAVGNGAVARIDSLVPSTAPTKVYVTVPTDAVSGVLTMWVGQYTIRSDSEFTLITGLKPVITGYAPHAGPWGSLVDLYGGNYDQRLSRVHVFFGPLAAVIDTIMENDMRVFVPSNAQTGPITVYMNRDTMITAPFTVTTRGHSISGFSPSWGRAGKLVGIEGARFGSDTLGLTVLFGSKRGAVQSVTDAQILAVVPAGAVTAPVTVDFYGERAVSLMPLQIYTGRYPFDTCVVSISNIAVRRRSYFSRGDSILSDRTDTIVTSFDNAPCGWRGGLQSDPAHQDQQTFVYATNAGPSDNCSSTTTLAVDTAQHLIRSATIALTGAMPQGGAGSTVIDATYVLNGLSILAQPDGTWQCQLSGSSAAPAIGSISFSSVSTSGMFHNGTVYEFVGCTDSTVVSVNVR